VDGELREGFILHAVRSDKGTLKNTAKSIKPSPIAKAIDPEVSDDWNDDKAILLMLTDYGLVHGTEPENGWLVNGKSYKVVTVWPHESQNFSLDYAPTFSGGRGWTVYPTSRNLLKNLGFIPPEHLNRKKAVTLRIRVIEESD
ncbi:MAG: hypothetical protein ACKO0V_20690, partial [bacterium]